MDAICTMAATLRLSFYAFALLTLVPIIWNVDEFICLVLLLAYCAAGVWVVMDVDMDVKNDNDNNNEKNKKTATTASFITKIKVDL